MKVPRLRIRHTRAKGNIMKPGYHLRRLGLFLSVAIFVLSFGSIPAAMLFQGIVNFGSPTVDASPLWAIVFVSGISAIVFGVLHWRHDLRTPER